MSHTIFSSAADLRAAGLDLSIVMPCLNEAETLVACIKKARAGLEAAGVKGEILIADNGSTDGSIELAEQNGARVVRVMRRATATPCAAASRRRAGVG
jgi:glycosyltransferase involved in cell wall biosynthesis